MQSILRPIDRKTCLVGRPMRAVAANRSAGVYVNQLSAPARPELDYPVHKGKEGVVTATPNVGPRVDPGPPLAHDDRAGRDRCAVEDLHSEALGLGVAPVPG